MVVELKGRTCTFFGAVPGSILPRGKLTVRYKFFREKEKKIIDDQMRGETQMGRDGAKKYFESPSSVSCRLLENNTKEAKKI